MGQTSSYAAGSDKRVAVLCVLDGSRKVGPPFPSEDGIGILETKDEAIAVVTVRGGQKQIELTVEDDGVGFDASRTRGLGLLGMEERVKQLAGIFHIESQLGKGTTLRVMLPTE